MPAFPEIFNRNPEYDQNYQSPHYREFDINLEHLDPPERDVIKRLSMIPQKLDRQYTYLKNEDFYPPTENEEEFNQLKVQLDEEAVANPEIKSHYTVVERDPKTGKLETIPYHQKFPRIHKELASSLQLALKVHGIDPVLKEYLEALQNSIGTDRYDQAEIIWLDQTRPSRVDLIFGPKESYNDKLLEVKYDWEWVLGVLDGETTSKVASYKDLVLKVQRRKKPDPKYNVGVWDVKSAAGLVIEYGFSAQTFPNDYHTAEKHGAKIIIFKQMMEEKIKNKIIPTAEAIFGRKQLSDLTSKDIADGNLFWLTGHEPHHILNRYPGDEDRNRGFYHKLSELHCSVSGLKTAFDLADRELLTQKELKSIIINHFAQIFVDYAECHLQGNKSIEDYTYGSVANYVFLQEMRVISDDNGKNILPENNKLKAANETLDGLLDFLASKGTQKETKDFFDRYNNPQSLKFSDHALNKIFNNPTSEVLAKN